MVGLIVQQITVRGYGFLPITLIIIWPKQKMTEPGCVRRFYLINLHLLKVE
jgi:hypothetical protein